MQRSLQAIFFRSMACAILITVIFLLLALEIKQQRLAAFDLRFSDAVQSMSTPSLTIVMKGFTNAGAGLTVTIIAVCLALILAVIGYRKELYVYASVIGASSLLNLLLKTLFHRARPDIHRIINAAGYSFPSGHSMAAFTMYALTIYFLWKHLRYLWARIAVISVGTFMIIMIGLSRIYLGVHYPSDVIGGYLISAAWLAASIGGYERFLAERWRSKKFRSVR